MVFHSPHPRHLLPDFQTQRQAFLNSHTYFGNQRFHFTGHGSGLMIPFAVTLFMTYAVFILCGLTMAFHLTNAGLTLLLIPFVLGPMWIWLLGQKQKYFWDHTTFGRPLFFRRHLAETLTLYIGNLALLLVTLGFAWPWVTVQECPVFHPHPFLQGPMNFDQDPARDHRSLGHRGRPVEPARHRLRYGLAPMPISWTAHYLDGRTATRHRITITITPTALQLLLSGGETKQWPYDQIRQTQGAYSGEPVRLEFGPETGRGTRYFHTSPVNRHATSGAYHGSALP